MKNINKIKVTFCPGPGAVLPQWFESQKEYFGRGDKEYDRLKTVTLKWLKKISGQDEIIPVSGAASTAAVVAFNTFLYDKILVVKTGYYSDRWYQYLTKNKIAKFVKEVSYNNFLKEKNIKTFNWVVFVYVETASCVKFDIKEIKKICLKNKIRLMVDATASIGLEKNHNLADVIFFSSCKGLFGPTGLGFISYKKNLVLSESKDFILNYKTHKNSMYTLGYNCMAALYSISKKHLLLKKKILYANKVISKFRLFKKNNPMIGIALKHKIKNKKNNNSIFYKSRLDPGYDVIFFLGLTKFDQKQIKYILKKRIISNLKK